MRMSELARKCFCVPQPRTRRPTAAHSVRSADLWASARNILVQQHKALLAVGQAQAVLLEARVGPVVDDHVHRAAGGAHDDADLPKRPRFSWTKRQAFNVPHVRSLDNLYLYLCFPDVFIRTAVGIRFWTEIKTRNKNTVIQISSGFCVAREFGIITGDRHFLCPPIILFVRALSLTF